MLATAFATVALLPGLLTGTVADVKDQTPLPVLLPSTMQTDEDPLYASGEANSKSYQIVVSTERDCGANACSLVFFSASKGGKAYGARTATLANGRKGRYNPLSCGGSCSPPSIVWKERGVVYEIQMDTTRSALVKMANSAIRRGPR